MCRPLLFWIYEERWSKERMLKGEMGVYVCCLLPVPDVVLWTQNVVNTWNRTNTGSRLCGPGNCGGKDMWRPFILKSQLQRYGTSYEHNLVYPSFYTCSSLVCFIPCISKREHWVLDWKLGFQMLHLLRSILSHFYFSLLWVTFICTIIMYI